MIVSFYVCLFRDIMPRVEVGSHEINEVYANV